MFRLLMVRECDRDVCKCFGIDRLYVHGYGDNDRECFEFFEYKVFFEYKMLGSFKGLNTRL